MKAAVISLGSVSSQWIAEAFEKYFDTVEHIDISELEVPLGGQAKVLYKGQPLEQYDCIYARGSYKYASLLGAATAAMQKTTYMPIRPEGFTIGHNKVLTHLRLQEHDIPQPTTYLAATADAGKKILKRVSFPIVMKLPTGTHGKGVVFADSPESASSMIDVLALLKQPFLMQEYIETEGRDYRCMVVGDKVVAAMKRISSRREKRANIHAGGVGEKMLPDMRTQKVAVAAAKACGIEICAVDMLPSAKGPLVLEVNTSPGLQGITKVTKINIAEIIAEYLFKKVKVIREKGKEKILQELETEQEIHGPLDFRGNRILLPEVVSMASKLKENEEVILKAKKGKIEITKT